MEVLKDCKTADDLKDFFRKQRKPNFLVFRKRRKDGVYEFWTINEEDDTIPDAAVLDALVPVSVHHKVINVKEELEKEPFSNLSLQKGTDGRSSPDGRLVDFFQDPECYLKGASFEVDDADGDPEKSQYSVLRDECSNMTRVLRHNKSNIDVYTDAVDLRSSCMACNSTDGCRCFKVLFLYTKKRAFDCITSADQKTFHELWCAWRSHFGDGVYTSQYAPEHFGSKLRVALNMYGGCDTDPFSDEPLCCLPKWEDIRTLQAVEAVAFCIPILVPQERLRNYKDTDPTGQFLPGRNRKGVKQHEGRDIWIIAPDNEGSYNVTADRRARLELLKMRQNNPKASLVSRMQAFADAALMLLMQGDLAEARDFFKEALQIQKSIRQTDFGPSLVQAYARCLRQQDTSESKAEAKKLLEEYGFMIQDDFGSKGEVELCEEEAGKQEDFQPGMKLRSIQDDSDSDVNWSGCPGRRLSFNIGKVFSIKEIRGSFFRATERNLWAPLSAFQDEGVGASAKSGGSEGGTASSQDAAPVGGTQPQGPAGRAFRKKGQQETFPDGKDAVPGLFSARFNDENKETEHKFRRVYEILKGHNFPVLMVAAKAGDDFGKLTTRYLSQIEENQGVLICVCTKHYAEITSSPFSSYHELKYAQEYQLDVLPLKVEDVYPPEPPSGKDHLYDKDGDAKATIKMVFKPNVVFEDCRDLDEMQIARKIADKLLKKKTPRDMSQPMQGSGRG
ncbi:unnamed protein product [Symbiodinium sp. CCMP2592]|nr:unnamed protein product [Symbiodinium sp. CCMP2592]